MNVLPAVTFIFLIFLALVGQFSLVYFTNVGATMVRNDEFFAKVFMNPLFHLSSFLFGMIMCLVYLRFRKERGYASALRNSFSSRMMEMIRHNQAPRYLMYLVALSCIISAVLWQTPFIGEPQNQSRLLNAVYGTLSFPLYLMGLSMIVMPALAARAAAFRFVFSNQTLTPFSHIAIGMYYTVPMIAIFYFMSTQH